MENLEIKTEDISDDVLLYIKEEDIEGENININHVKEEEVLEVKEECEHEGVGSQFETIFLPDIYNDVVVETPFFDFNSYRKRCGLSTEDDEINECHMNVYFNRENLENHEYRNLQVGYDKQSKSENVPDSCIPTYSVSFIDLDSTENSCTVSHSTDEQNCDKIPIESTQYVNENVIHSENGFVQAYIESCVKRKTKKYTRNKLFKNNILQQDCQVKDQIQQVSGSEDTSHNENRHSQMFPEPMVSSYSETPINPVRKNKRHKEKNDDAKYKCPVCKRLRVFDTLLAINNHLKFEHLSMFSNQTGELIEKIFPRTKDVEFVEEILEID